MEEETKKIKIIGENGEFEVEPMVQFALTKFNKEYIIYTKNEVDENDNVTIYVSEVVKSDNGDTVLKGVETDEEWTAIKEVLKEVARSN